MYYLIRMQTAASSIKQPLAAQQFLAITRETSVRYQPQRRRYSGAVIGLPHNLHALPVIAPNPLHG